MPKVTHNRKLHGSAPKFNKNEGSTQRNDDVEEDVFEKANVTSFVKVPHVDLDINLLKNNIKSLNNVAPPAPLPLQPQEFVDRRPQPLAKKEKRKQKKQAFLKKLEPFAKRQPGPLSSEEKEQQQRKQQLQQPQQASSLSINSDEFMSALQELMGSDDDDDKAQRPGTGTSATMTNRKKKKIAAREIQQYKSVISHPQFQADPFATLKEHLTNSVAMQNQKLEDQKKLAAQQSKIMNKKPMAKKPSKPKQKKEQPGNVYYSKQQKNSGGHSSSMDMG
ncbi:hypothetical protein SAMD00019534_054530 [Acytostelium subglobosum LB1]|uniref:hypothetical protein n=1 Tax=Acytostelium subglobosum LB1 TaxID=1410327 RepID=UPI0006450F7E|nr:hypothetical protein SAMD00019534_054530 [Acytostelium subglobosum LB1]GAM22278.1 hypothetical protein SAMD00019534_054530 [Acytostelium subglobosum LB1]|eukprot:XP_012754398.1 hypothetical protein SAMD00019534_054530 [Acytostelium subglobosum LB1]